MSDVNVCIHHTADARYNGHNVCTGSGVTRKWPCAGGEVPLDRRETDPTWSTARWPCVTLRGLACRVACPAFRQTPDAILFEPSADDPHGLLRLGPCGARPPRAWLVPHTGTAFSRWQSWLVTKVNGKSRVGLRASADKALVLAWDGEVVVDGCLRADVALEETLGTHARLVEAALKGDVVEFWPGGHILYLDTGGLHLGTHGQELV